MQRLYTRRVLEKRLFALVVSIAAGGVVTACGASSSPMPAATVTITARAAHSARSSGLAGAALMLPPQSCRRVATGADGNVGPVLCSNGHPNAFALPSLQNVAPRMMALGQFATSAEILAAACADLASGSTNPIEHSAYQFIASAEWMVVRGRPHRQRHVHRMCALAKYYYY